MSILRICRQEVCKYNDQATSSSNSETRLNSVETGNSSSEIPQQTMNGHITT